MKQKLSHFSLCAMFLCAGINYCFGTIFLSKNQFSNSIYNNNWPTLEDDVEIIKNNIQSQKMISGPMPITLSMPAALSEVIQSLLELEYNEKTISGFLSKLINGEEESIFDYLKFANTLVLYGRDKHIITAAYDIATAVMNKIDEFNGTLQSTLKELIEETTKTLSLCEKGFNVLVEFHKAYSKKDLKLLEKIIKIQKSIALRAQNKLIEKRGNH